jgi:RimJ/RimL family protein N-acetyltransferase
MRFDLRNCIVRPWCDGDLSTLVHHANNRNIWINLRDRFPHPYTEQDGTRWLAIARASPPDTNFAIEIDGQAAGGIGLERQADVERTSAEIGFWLGEPFWGRGIMTAVVTAVGDWALQEQSLVRLYAAVFEWNAASMRVLENAGFEREGWMRNSAIKDGRIVNRALYAKVRGAA